MEKRYRNKIIIIIIIIIIINFKPFGRYISPFRFFGQRFVSSGRCVSFIVLFTKSVIIFSDLVTVACFNCCNYLERDLLCLAGLLAQCPISSSWLFRQ